MVVGSDVFMSSAAFFWALCLLIVLECTLALMCSQMEGLKKAVKTEYLYDKP